MDQTLGSINSSPRLFIHDKSNKIKFLIDSGSDISVLPKQLVNQLDLPFQDNVSAVNNADF